MLCTVCSTLITVKCQVVFLTKKCKAAWKKCEAGRLADYIPGETLHMKRFSVVWLADRNATLPLSSGRYRCTAVCQPTSSVHRPETAANTHLAEQDLTTYSHLETAISPLQSLFLMYTHMKKWLSPSIWAQFIGCGNHKSESNPPSFEQHTLAT